MSTPPTLKSLAALATKFPSGHVPKSRNESVEMDSAGHARQALAARFGPEVALAVYSAMEYALKSMRASNCDSMAETALIKALALLDGQSQGEGK